MKADKIQKMVSDEDLCRWAARGDRGAEEALVRRYYRMVRMCARPLFLAGGDSEDLTQEGMVGLLSAIREFDPDKGTAFHTYAETCIRNRIRSAIREALRDKHTPLNHSVSFEAPLLVGSDDSYPCGATQSAGQSPEDMLISREERQERLGTLRGQLSGFEKEILRLYLQGLSYAEIAAQTDRSPKAVDNAVQRIRRKVAQHLTSGDFSES